MLPASVQSSPSTVAAGPGRRAGRRTRGRAGRRAGARLGRAAAATPLPIAAHADHQVPAPVHAQQHLGHLPGATGVLDPYPAAPALVDRTGLLPRAAAKHGEAHAGVPAAIRPKGGIQRHALIDHSYSAFPSARRKDSRAGYWPIHRPMVSLCHGNALRSN